MAALVLETEVGSKVQSICKSDYRYGSIGIVIPITDEDGDVEGCDYLVWFEDMDPEALEAGASEWEAHCALYSEDQLVFL